MHWGRSIWLLGLALIVAMQPVHGAASGNGTAPAATAGSDSPRQILVLGDSLSAEYGLPRDSGWVSVITQRLKEQNPAYQIRNASISGDTTGNGLRRLPAMLDEFAADIVIIQLGANDGLRGLPLEEMKTNLQGIIDLAKAKGAKVLLVGQRIPPNYGKRYAERFHETYTELAKENALALVPFMLEAIALDSAMFQADGLHPTVKAQSHIAETIWPHLKAML